MTSRRRRMLGVVALACVPLAGCARGCTSSRPPIHLNPSMDDQPKVRPQTASSFFFNGASMREPVPGTIPIGGLKEDAAFFTGKGADGQFVATIPQPVDDALVERGRPPRARRPCPPLWGARRLRPCGRDRSTGALAGIGGRCGQPPAASPALPTEAALPNSLDSS